jgi:hypothetical protein
MFISSGFRGIALYKTRIDDRLPTRTGNDSVGASVLIMKVIFKLIASEAIRLLELILFRKNGSHFGTRN